MEPIDMRDFYLCSRRDDFAEAAQAMFCADV
jgi:hypothetical protein